MLTHNTSRRSFLLAGAAVSLQGQGQKKLKVGVIGTGHRAWAHINIIKKTIPDIEVAALADITPANLDRAATLAGSQAARYSDYKKMLAEQKGLDAVLVAVPDFLHAEVTIAALNRGLNVLCEKPMALTIDDANRMIAASERAHKILEIGQQMRYTPLYEKMADLIQGGQIGTVEFASGHLYRGDWNPASWQYPNPKTGKPTIWRFLTVTTGSSLLEDGIHELDVLHWMIGSRPSRVYATGGNNVLKDRETIDHAIVAVDFDSGVKLSFDFSLFASAAGPISREMVLIGNQGVLQPEGEKLVVRKRGTQPKTIEPADSTPRAVGAKPVGTDEDSGTHREWIAFLESVRTGKQPRCNGQVGKEAIRIPLMAEKSIHEKRIVNFGDLPA
jgi:predicted dehydrogenase